MGLDRHLSELMRRAQDGDRRAYDALLTEVTGLVRAFARARLPHADGVEDVAQETLLAIHRDRHAWDAGRPFLPWMYAIARNRLLDLVAKRRRQQLNEVGSDRLLEEVASSAPGADREPANRFLRRALAMLSTRQREIIQMLKFDELSVADISLKTGMSRSSVKITAHRGYKALRKLVGEPGS